ncbi:hypothetical protein J6590_103339 [Homalodisca vitripennis]|nr:hypothetical protein J6590_103339 [Homalodisca vitripennis]
MVGFLSYRGNRKEIEREGGVCSLTPTHRSSIGTTMRGRDTNNATDIVFPLQSTGRDNDEVTTKLSDNWCAHITSVLVM